jgi:hypothetical protein
MEQNIKKKWMAGGFAFFLFWILSLSAFCQAASIKEVETKGSDGVWKVSFLVANCFTDKMDEAIQSGMKTAFTFSLQLYQKRKILKDRKLASMEFRHTIRFDPIRGEYLVTFGEGQSSRVTSNLEEAKRWMAKVEEVEVRSFSKLKPKTTTELRIKAELDPVKLPFHLEYLFFFVSLWDFETKWHVEPLHP